MMVFEHKSVGSQVARNISLDVFSDPVCPWCLVGLRRLDRAIAALPDDVAVTVTHHPFMLDANAPPEGEDVVEMLKRKYGRDPSQMWDRLEAEAARSGVELDMRKQKLRYPSQRAQVLIAAAGVGDGGKQHKLAIAIGDAHYLDGRNISDPEVLVEIADKFGFEAEKVRQLVTDPELTKAIESQAASASAQGISGVPFFVFANKYALSGAQPEAVFKQAFDAVIKETA